MLHPFEPIAALEARYERLDDALGFLEIADLDAGDAGFPRRMIVPSDEQGIA